MSKDETLKELSRFESRAHIQYMEVLNKIERNSYIIMTLATGYTLILVALILG